MADDEGLEPDFEKLIDFVQEHRGVDFRGYKRTSLRRRFAKRMDEVGAGGFADYQALLEANPQEFAALLDTALINVTGFFRDPDAWDVLRREVVPRLVERHRESGTGIRVWSAGSASGQ